MKKLMLTLALLVSVISGAMAQNDAMYIYRDGVVQNAFLKTEIDSITYDYLDGEYYQTIWTRGFTISMSLSSIDNTCFANLSSYAVPEKFVTFLDSSTLNDKWDNGLISADGNFSFIKTDRLGGSLVVIGNVNSDEHFICQYDDSGTLCSIIFTDYSVTFTNWRDCYVDCHITDETGAVTSYIDYPINVKAVRPKRRIEGVITTNTNDNGLTSKLLNLYTMSSLFEGLLSGDKFATFMAGSELTAGASNLNGLEFALNVIEGLKSGNWIGTALTAANNALKVIEMSHSCPDNNHPHAIDLGLPSGTKWCCMNVGASSPEEYGGYYAWGEVNEKNYYDWDTYAYYNDNVGMINIGSEIAGTSYDVAHVRMGGSWRMPSYEQQLELMNNCTRTWTQQNGVSGILVTGKNGGQLFLPAAGYRWRSDLYEAGSYGSYWSSSHGPSGGSYWSSSLGPSGGGHACSLDLDSANWYWYYYSLRFDGRSVRGVCP